MKVARTLYVLGFVITMIACALINKNVMIATVIALSGLAMIFTGIQIEEWYEWKESEE